MKICLVGGIFDRPRRCGPSRGNVSHSDESLATWSKAGQRAKRGPLDRSVRPLVEVYGAAAATA